jgi:hypothetical protein
MRELTALSDRYPRDFANADELASRHDLLMEKEAPGLNPRTHSDDPAQGSTPYQDRPADEGKDGDAAEEPTPAPFGNGKTQTPQPASGDVQRP